MNILHISRTMGQGGAEKIVYQLAVSGKANGHKVCIASTGGEYVKQLEKQDVSHVDIYDLECKKPQVILKNLYVLAKIVKEKKINVIHSHHRMAACYAVILNVFFTKVKLVYTAHNVFYDKQKLTQMSLSNSKIAAVGDNVKRNLIEEFHIEPGKIDVIHNGVEIEEHNEMFELAELNATKQDGYTLLGAIGRLSEQKGMDIFIRAIKQAKEQNPMIKGVIIGDGELRADLNKLIEELNLKEDILMLGYQKHVTVLISQLDFVVMPSRWEGFPLTPIEVFAMGKTMIGSDIGGMNEIIVDGKNGLLIQKDDVEGFKSAILKLVHEKEFREYLEKNAKKTFEQNFHYRIFVEKYMQLYQDVSIEV